MKLAAILCLALVCLGGFLWLSRNSQVVEVKAVQRGSDEIRRDAGASDAPAEASAIRQSKRHAAGEVEIERQRRQRLAELDKAVRAQEDRVEERRMRLATIVRTKGIIYRGQDSDHSQSEVMEDPDGRTTLQVFHGLEQEKMQLESQISSLLKYDSEQLLVYAAGLDLPDNTIRTKYPLYLEARRQLEGYRVNGLSERHPTVLAAMEKVATMRKELDEGVVNLRTTLKARLDLATERLKSVDMMKDAARVVPGTKGLDAHDYVEAKRDFEIQQELLQQMKLLRQAERLKQQ